MTHGHRLAAVAGLQTMERTRLEDGLEGRKPSGTLFFTVVLPCLAILNLALGAALLLSLGPRTWQDRALSAAGAFCCLVAGWLLSAGWSKWYWSRILDHQISAWRSMVNAFVRWLEDAPVPVDSLRRLDRSLRDARHDL